MKKIEILGLETIPQIQQGDNLPEMINKSAAEEIGGIEEKDIIVITSKIVSKALGLTKKLDEIRPRKKALAISKKTGADARYLELIFQQNHKILAVIPLKGYIERCILDASIDENRSKEVCALKGAVNITQDKNGRFYTCDAGIDRSNNPKGLVSLLPEDLDAQAKRLRLEIQKLTGKHIAVILADTEMVPFGTMDFALGSSGISPRAKDFGKLDSFKRPKFGGIDLVAHELTSAAVLALGQLNQAIPVVVIRGYEYEISETENISNTLLSRMSDSDRRKTIKSILRATSYTKGFKERILLRLASWFV